MGHKLQTMADKAKAAHVAHAKRSLIGPQAHQAEKDFSARVFAGYVEAIDKDMLALKKMMNDLKRAKEEMLAEEKKMMAEPIKI